MVNLNKNLAVGVFAMIFTILLIGNAFQIQDFEGVSYRNHTDVVYDYPGGVNNTTWENSSTENIVVNSDGYLMADLNDYARWESEALRLDDNRKIIYEVDSASKGELGITVKVSDSEDFTNIKDIQKDSLQDGFNEIDLSMDRAKYTKVVIEFDKAADSSDAVNTMSVQGIKSNVKTGFSDILGLALFLILFWFGVRVFGGALGWWD
jgi:hypothetical protein